MLTTLSAFKGCDAGSRCAPATRVRSQVGVVPSALVTEGDDRR